MSNNKLTLGMLTKGLPTLGGDNEAKAVAL